MNRPGVTRFFGRTILTNKNLGAIIIGIALALSACSSEEQEEAEVASVRLNPDVINLGLRAKVKLSQSFGSLPEITSPEEKKKLQAQRKKGDRDEELEDAADLFKTDPAYLAMDRLEKAKVYVEKVRIPISKFAEGLESNFPVRERPLIFSGEGFEIHDFETLSMQMNEFRYDDHLQILYPHQVKEKSLTTQVFSGDYARSERHLIFHPSATVWGKDPPPLLANDASAMGEEAMTVSLELEKIPETKLSFIPGQPTQMVLSRNTGALNLLTGNEAINKHRYQTGYRGDIN